MTILEHINFWLNKNDVHLTENNQTLDTILHKKTKQLCISNDLMELTLYDSTNTVYVFTIIGQKNISVKINNKLLGLITYTK